MLPFLKKKESASPGLLIKTRTPDESAEPDQNDPDAAREACGMALKAALESGDGIAIADAFQDLIDLGPATPEMDMMEPDDV